MPVLDQSIDFDLPPELEARMPPEARGLNRDQVRLLISERATDRLIHSDFSALPSFLSPGDLVVVNDSGTLPAEITARRSDGTSFPLRFSTQLDDGRWVVEPRDVQVVSGSVLCLPGGATATILRPYANSLRLWIARLQLFSSPVQYLLRWGRPIRYSYVPKSWPLEAYQTVFHDELGSAEMPSAGRPFTREVFDRLAAKGVETVRLTLHTGVSSAEKHEAPYEESFKVPVDTAAAVNRIHARGGRVIAVGTTVVRALESASDRWGEVHPTHGRTDLIITPQRGVRVVDGLLTGFHEPRATHLAMLEAIASREHLVKAYAAAIEKGYLWHEFGDVHLIM